MGEPENDTHAPRLSFGALFLKFLRFGAFAWGGPVAQIGMLKAELVDQERWITPARFNRALALYQVLPGPEAHELCIYLGMLSRGRVGGFLAGLGFMLPGLVLMLLLSWVYLRYGTHAAWVQASFQGAQAAVAALVVRAVHRIGAHSLMDRWLIACAGISLAAQLWGAHFALILLCTGLAYVLARGKRPLLGAVPLAVLVFCVLSLGGQGAVSLPPLGTLRENVPSLPRVFASGLKGGLLTFGGAYTLIPFLREDAVQWGRWMSDATFLDGLALAGVLPAPLSIFGTFVGYVAKGLTGALLMTLGIFLPAFAMTLLAHHTLERWVEKKELHTLLEGITAGVVGLIAGTAVMLVRNSVSTPVTVGVFLLGGVLLYGWANRFVTPVVVFVGALMGWVFLS